MMLSMIAVLFLAVCSTTVTAQIEGGTCGVGGAEDFFKSDFKGPYLVSGPGCQLGHAKDCYCTVDYGNAESNGWIWLCGTTVFGPAEGKTCPAEIPVMEGSDVHPDCDTAVNPTGVSEADAGCEYSDCEQGGNDSALCACVDLALYNLGEGQKWYCIHATCSCGETGTLQTSNETSSAVNSGVNCVISFMAAAVIALLAVIN